MLHAPREQHDAIVREGIGPLLREVRRIPSLDALFFGRYNKPDWHLRLSVVGRPEWVGSDVRAFLDRLAGELRAAGRIREFEIADYERDEEAFGGEEGARIAERIFQLDTEACIDWLDAESRGRTSRSRREHCLVMTERYLDLMHLTRVQRIAFYRHAYSFEVDLGRWQSEEIEKLERHYRSIRDGLLDLFAGETSRDPARVWGGDEPASIARACIDAIRPLAEELLRACREGGRRKNRIDLAWSLTHMHANRLQVEADAEAIIRFFMCRLHQDADLMAVDQGEARP